MFWYIALFSHIINVTEFFLISNYIHVCSLRSIRLDSNGLYQSMCYTHNETTGSYNNVIPKCSPYLIAPPPPPPPPPHIYAIQTANASIRHRSDTFTSDRCLFDINTLVFALLSGKGHPSKINDWQYSGKSAMRPSRLWNLPYKNIEYCICKLNYPSGQSALH